jgi:hypothetical protein
MNGRRGLLAGRLRRLERVRIGDPELVIVKCHESVVRSAWRNACARPSARTIHGIWW